eukprot:m.82777 g.82777  ORF g.82777 m.82777 type:complete len:105 (+) comp11139_c0_seq1:959-1273(+)
MECSCCAPSAASFSASFASPDGGCFRGCDIDPSGTVQSQRCQWSPPRQRLTRLSKVVGVDDRGQLKQYLAPQKHVFSKQKKARQQQETPAWSARLRVIRSRRVT